MNAKAALCKFLLEGRVLSLENCFKEVGLSNPGREVPRMVEKPFGVIVSRTPRTGKNRYGSSVSFTQYRLNRSEYNVAGISLMREYILSHSTKNPRTDKEVKEKREVDKLQLF